MSMTKGRLRETLPPADDVERYQVQSNRFSAAVARPRGVESDSRIHRSSRWLLVAWAMILTSVFLLEPAPTHPHAPVPLWSSLLLTAFAVGFSVALAGLLRGRPWAFKASSVAAGLGLVIGLACALTDHHPIFWWSYEVVAFTALIGLSELAAARDIKR